MVKQTEKKINRLFVILLANCGLQTWIWWLNDFEDRKVYKWFPFHDSLPTLHQQFTYPLWFRPIIRRVNIYDSSEFVLYAIFPLLIFVIYMIFLRRE